MSNSIWKTPDQKPDSRKQILIYDGVDYSIEISHPEYWEDKGLVEKWCYLDELLAQADKAERLQKQLDSLKKYSDSLRNRINKMLKKNKTLKNTASDYFMKSVELGIELEKMKSNN